MYCKWLWHSATVLCDGTVTCGLDDPFKLRSYGSLKRGSLREILNSQPVHDRRQSLLNGQECHGCELHSHINPSNMHDLAPTAPEPRRLVIEASIKCNIRCNNSICNIANDKTIHLRREDFMSWGMFCNLVEQSAHHVKEIMFFNYGEAFMHPRALDMLSFIRRTNPDARVVSSTNGILLNNNMMAERIVDENLLDSLCFTIGGVDEETYTKYHKAGSFAKAFEGMRRMIDRKHKTGLKTPNIHWRYLLFNWNDSDEHIETAVRLAREIGVDEFKIFLTGTPLEGRSLRRAPGTSGFAAIAEHVDYEVHYQPDIMAEAGLWQVEGNESEDAFAWTSERATVLLKPSDGRITVRLKRPQGYLIDDVEVSIVTPWGRYDAAVGRDLWGVNAIDVPEQYDAAQVKIGLDISKTFMPFREGLNDDHRPLGVMIAMDGVRPYPNPHR